ncbi:MAG TPA: J domain-containing protein [Segetibacter sp.]|jgi:curved DNA-binding protein CbpA
MKDYYSILEVDQNASKAQIREAFKKLSVKLHPDKNNGDEYLTEVFKEVNEARQILIDDEKRAEYDEELNNSFPKKSFLRNLKKANKYKVTSDLQKPRLWNSFVIAFFIASGLAVISFFIFFSVFEEQDRTNILEINRSTETKTDVVENFSPKDTGSASFVIEETAQTTLFKENDTTTLHLKEADKSELLQAESTVTASPAENEPTQNIASKVVKETVSNAVKKPVVIQKKLSKLQLTHIYNRVTRLRQLNSKINCVKVQKTESSNVNNAFSVATFLKSKGFIISGREKINKIMEGASVIANNSCIIVTIGKY